jgi:hypothetical protein
MGYHSQAWQDEFVANILNFKHNGYYIDIGSSIPYHLNNSYFFETELHWQGICVERGSDYNEDYKKRTCHFINDDATKLDYRKILTDMNFPKQADYLSIDIDESSADALALLPLDIHRFSVITIEHDANRFGDTLRSAERKILYSHNYMLLFSDVLVPLGCGMGPNLPFEDWWIDPTIFNARKAQSLAADKAYPDDIVNMIKNNPPRDIIL